MPTKTQADRVYRHLRSKLLAGDLKPGTRIRYGPYGKQLGVSATPVREAIGQLASEGFVELIPQLGAVVRSLGRGEAIELYEMREALETYAAEKAAAQFSERGLNGLRSQLERLEEITAEVAREPDAVPSADIIRKFNAADLAFHMVILEASGNARIVKVVGDTHMLARIFASDRHGYDLEVMRATCEEHRAILKALLRCDGAATREAMRKHIGHSLELTLEAFDDTDADRWLS